MAMELGFEHVLENELDLLGAPPNIPAVICGMAGAKGGWVEAGYLDLSTPLTEIANFTVKAPNCQRVIHILPGVARKVRSDPDVMRGEETMLLGLGAFGMLDCDRLICIPGTHAKWIFTEANRIRDFKTYVTGELFDVIGNNTILGQSLHTSSSTFGPSEMEAFRIGIKRAWRDPSSLTHHLFTIRASAVLYDADPGLLAALLSGLLIGAELSGELGNESSIPPVTLLAAGNLASRYLIGMQTIGIECTVIDAEKAVLGGLTNAALELGCLRPFHEQVAAK